MKVKKYMASTMPEVMKQIRSDLGSDAVILNSKEIRHGGFLGLFKKKRIEVVAALDPQPIAPKRHDVIESSNDQYALSEQKSQANNMNLDVLNEIRYLKKILEQQSKKIRGNYLPDYQLAYQHLLEQEVESELAEEIVDAVIKQHEENGNRSTPSLIIQDVQLEIERRLAEVSFLGITYEQRIIHFVGPTGVGKTTTLAKIAANCILKDHKKIAFITMDTYRIAAIEQLKTYAQILDVPIEVAYTTKEYHDAINTFSSYDLILVDTAGRNFRDEKYVKELQISNTLDIKTYLVLSLTAKPNDVTDIQAQFSHLPIKDVIFTKLDETRQFGSIINMALQNHVGIAYLTDGQDVPEDIIQPTPQKVSNYITGGYVDE